MANSTVPAVVLSNLSDPSTLASAILQKPNREPNRVFSPKNSNSPVKENSRPDCAVAFFGANAGTQTPEPQLVGRVSIGTQTQPIDPNVALRALNMPLTKYEQNMLPHLIKKLNEVLSDYSSGVFKVSGISVLPGSHVL